VVDMWVNAGFVLRANIFQEGGTLQLALPARQGQLELTLPVPSCRKVSIR